MEPPLLYPALYEPRERPKVFESGLTSGKERRKREKRVNSTCFRYMFFGCHTIFFCSVDLFVGQYAEIVRCIVGELLERLPRNTLMVGLVASFVSAAKA